MTDRSQALAGPAAGDHAAGDHTGADRRHTDDSGMATTEYALVTVAAAGFAGVLVVLLKSEQVRELLLGIVTSALG
jgi:hypothetical protein